MIGRYPALEEFKKAARLEPTDPAPLYWQMKVGFYLRSDEGDYMARATHGENPVALERRVELLLALEQGRAP